MFQLAIGGRSARALLLALALSATPLSATVILSFDPQSSSASSDGELDYDLGANIIPGTEVDGFKAFGNFGVSGANFLSARWVFRAEGSTTQSSAPVKANFLMSALEPGQNVNLSLSWTIFYTNESATSVATLNSFTGPDEEVGLFSLQNLLQIDIPELQLPIQPGAFWQSMEVVLEADGGFDDFGPLSLPEGFQLVVPENSIDLLPTARNVNPPGDPNAIPEPASFAVLGAALAFVVWRRQR
jgi:hypothetical protein